MGHTASKHKKKGVVEKERSKSKIKKSKKHLSSSKDSIPNNDNSPNLREGDKHGGVDSPSLSSVTATATGTTGTSTTATTTSTTSSPSPSPSASPAPSPFPRTPSGRRSSLRPAKSPRPKKQIAKSGDSIKQDEKHLEKKHDEKRDEEKSHENGESSNGAPHHHTHSEPHPEPDLSEPHDHPNGHSLQNSLSQSSDTNSESMSDDRGEHERMEGSSSNGKNKLMESTIFDNPDGNEVEEELEDEDPECALCGENEYNIYVLEVCGHNVCVPCLYEYSELKLKELSPDDHEILCPIPDCSCIISTSDLKTALETFGANIATGEEEGNGGEGRADGDPGSSSSPNLLQQSVPVALPIQLTQSLEVLLSKGNYVHCPNPKCKFVFEKLPSTPKRKGDIVLDEMGNPISQEAVKHREEYRFRCRVCGTNFCSACKSVPYHLGFTCKQKMASMRAKHCRFCDVSLPASTKPHPYATMTTAITNTLTKKKEKRSRSFLQSLRFKGKEKNKSELDLASLSSSDGAESLDEFPREYYVCKSRDCTIKMNSACPKFAKCGHVCNGTSTDLESECFCLKEGCCGGQNADEFCNICYVESLGSGPCFRLNCSHVFHESCLKSKLSKQWPGPAISFSFMNCPLCTQVIHHRCIDYIVSPFVALFDQVKARALQRLEIEGMLNDPRIIEPESDFHGKPAEYAMSIFSFYMCYICKNPYFGGRRACEQPEGADAGAYNPAELLCGGCSTLNAECKKHGKEYIEFKCRFCCSIATFYCGGKAHFCTPCHDRAGQLVEFANWTTIAKCEPCKGPEACPLGVAHGENGEEFSLGCSMCRAAIP